MLQPSYTLNLGTQQWTRQALELDLSLTPAPQVDRLEIRFPTAAAVSAEIGDPVELTLHSGEQESPVFSGTLTSLEHTLSEIRVRALNAGGTLAGFRPAATYENVSAGTVLKNLCEEAGVDVADAEDGVPLAFYVADGLRSAWEHIARVCAWSGALARVTAENAVEALVIDATTAEIAIRYGREVLALAGTSRNRPIESFTVVGQSGAGDTSAPEAFRPSVDFFDGNRPENPALQRRWHMEPALRTISAAARASAATQRTYQSSALQGRLDSLLLPTLRPGSVLEIQDTPKHLPSGPVVVVSVRHRIHPQRGGASTQARFHQGGDAFDPNALLGSLLGAVRSLL